MRFKSLLKAPGTRLFLGLGFLRRPSLILAGEAGTKKRHPSCLLIGGQQVGQGTGCIPSCKYLEVFLVLP